MPSILTNTRYQAFATVALVIGFMLAGLWFGIRPDAADKGTFGDVLKAFARETQTKTIVTFILIDVVTGVIAALRVGTFDGQRFAAFMSSNVLPYLFGYMLFWFVSYFGLTDVLTPEIAATLSNFGFGAVMSALSMSVVDNLTRARAGSTPPADIHEFLAPNVEVKNPQG
jgi:hypothetical protein